MGVGMGMELGRGRLGRGRGIDIFELWPMSRDAVLECFMCWWYHGRKSTAFQAGQIDRYFLICAFVVHNLGVN